MKSNSNLKSLDQFIVEQYGKKGSVKRDTFEKGFIKFKLSFVIQNKIAKGLFN